MEKLFRWVLAVIKTSIDNTRLIFIPGIHSWTNTKVKEFIHSRSKKFKNNILSVKRITKFNDIFEKVITGVEISYCRCSKWNHKSQVIKMSIEFQRKQDVCLNKTNFDEWSFLIKHTSMVKKKSKLTHQYDDSHSDLSEQLKTAKNYDALTKTIISSNEIYTGIENADKHNTFLGKLEKFKILFLSFPVDLKIRLQLRGNEDVDNFIKDITKQPAINGNYMDNNLKKNTLYKSKNTFLLIKQNTAIFANLEEPEFSFDKLKEMYNKELNTPESSTKEEDP
ncbi:hypothetical protein H8356DRAFT_1387316 [Neocallimastix lanati (nom. inval.)]|nr:hypothetical protein H8356DRAFT_1387316 [Neocallimastix sp. JGI-2020a]